MPLREVCAFVVSFRCDGSRHKGPAALANLSEP